MFFSLNLVEPGTALLTSMGLGKEASREVRIAKRGKTRMEPIPKNCECQEQTQNNAEQTLICQTLIFDTDGRPRRVASA